MAERLVAGIIGDNVKGSLSPTLHKAAAVKMGLDLDYQIWELSGFEELSRKRYIEQILREKAEQEVVGISVTKPFKQDVLWGAYDKSKAVKMIGATNTLSRPDEKGQWKADSTDWFGAVEALREAEVEIEGSTALVLGGGGTAPSVAFGLAERGIKNIFIANRTRERAGDIAAHIRSNYPGITTQGIGLPDSRIPEIIAEADIIFNATSVGQDGISSPLRLEDLATARTGIAICDAVYMPRVTTPLLARAESLGKLTVIDGTRMLLHQAVPQVRAFTGFEDVPIDGMDVALQAEIATRQGVDR